VTVTAGKDRPASGRVASLEAIRGHFPALARTHRGLPVAYFDGPGGTQVASAVVEAMRDYLLNHNANTAWAYPSSEETDAMLAAARAAMADFLNATPAEVAFGNNMTTLTFHLARALGAGWKAGDEIVVTDLEHHANIAPWRRLEQERGVVVKRAQVLLDRERNGSLNWESLERAIGPRTRLVAIGAGSNALGTITDVARAARLARAEKQTGALVFVDAVHYAPHELPDVRAMDCDFLVCSPYKFYGPHSGVLFGKKERIEALDVPRLEPAPDWSPERVETGTLNHEGIVGSGAAVDFLASLAGAAAGATRRARLEATYRELQARGRSLFERMWTGLSAIPGVTLYGLAPHKPRTPTVAFTVRGYPSKQVAQRLAERAVFVSHGDFYAATIVELLGHAADGLVRAGCACYTSGEEIERLIEGVAALAST